MKKFSEIIVESTDKDFAHFKKHASGYINHANKAAELEDKGQENRAEDHWEKSRAHTAEIEKHHGSKIATHMHENMTEASDAKEVWDSRPKN